MHYQSREFPTYNSELATLPPTPSSSLLQHAHRTGTRNVETMRIVCKFRRSHPQVLYRKICSKMFSEKHSRQGPVLTKLLKVHKCTKKVFRYRCYLRSFPKFVEQLFCYQQAAASVIGPYLLYCCCDFFSMTLWHKRTKIEQNTYNISPTVILCVDGGK